MYKREPKTRLLWSVGVVCAFFLILCIAVVKIQVVDRDKYSSENSSISSRTATIKASRGEILDSNGNPLVTNRQGNSIIFESAFFPPFSEQEKRNKIILSLIHQFEAAGEEWIDNLPLVLSPTGKIVFAPDREADIATMKSKDLLNLNEYANAQNCMDALIKRYKLESYSLADARKIASVCYEMKRLMFSISYPYTFARDVSTVLAAKIKENSNFYKGVSVEIESYREYADGTIAPHILGMVGAISAEEYASLKEDGYGINDIIGKNGLESAMESYLRGTDGVKLVTKSADGKIGTKILDEPQQGGTVITTIDVNLQRVVQNALKNTLHSIKSSMSPAGAAVVLNVNTGEVLACASYPSYDLSTYKENYSELAADENAPLWNRALLSTYEPGSTIKMSVALAALEEGVITPETVVWCTGTYKYLDSEFKCEQAHTTSMQTLTRALSESCNIYFYECGKQLGYQKINEYRTLLGLGQKTGIELSEATGVMDSPEYRASIGSAWYPGYNIQTAIGQGNLFTPIQLANYCSIIANNGTRYRLHFVKSVKSYDYNETMLETDNEVLGKTGFRQENIDAVKKGMLAFCTTGSGAKYFKELPYDIGGKTGTSQAFRTIRGVSQKINNAFFVSFAPFDNPEIAMCIVGEGCSTSTAIIPIAAEIYDYYFSNSGTVSPAQNEGVLLG